MANEATDYPIFEVLREWADSSWTGQTGEMNRKHQSRLLVQTPHADHEKVG